MNVLVTDIEWDTDGAKVGGLPDKVIIKGLPPNMAEVEDEISDYLSDTYGFCHNGFSFEVLKSA